MREPFTGSLESPTTSGQAISGESSGPHEVGRDDRSSVLRTEPPGCAGWNLAGREEGVSCGASSERDELRHYAGVRGRIFHQSAPLDPVLFVIFNGVFLLGSGLLMVRYGPGSIRADGQWVWPVTPGRRPRALSSSLQ